ncbi:hypothetical protein FRB90_001048 [Tulasnella sp. 427]|nr:hypothetical protein FRB90_001048 [Tulasnella sp. 427]
MSARQVSLLLDESAGNVAAKQLNVAATDASELLDQASDDLSLEWVCKKARPLRSLRSSTKTYLAESGLHAKSPLKSTSPPPHHFTVCVTTEFKGDNNYGGDGIPHQGQGQVWPPDFPPTLQIDGSLLLIPPPGFDELIKGDPYSIQEAGSEPGVLDFDVITQFGGHGGLNFGGKSKYLEGFKGAYGKIKRYNLLR